jgi:hypothetical protein
MTAWPEASRPLMTRTGHKPDRNPAAHQSPAVSRCGIVGVEAQEGIGRGPPCLVGWCSPCCSCWVVVSLMPLYWLCYRHNNQIVVVIEPGTSPIHARMRASLAKLDEGDFTEGHELDRKTEKQIPKAMIGQRLSQAEAKRLLAKFD